MTSSTILKAAVPPEAVLEFIEPGADIIMPNANGEPVELVDTLELHAGELQGVRIHQMHALRERRYIAANSAIACDTCRTSWRRPRGRPIKPANAS